MSKRFVKVFSAESRDSASAQVAIEQMIMKFISAQAGREIVDVRPTEMLSPDSEGRPWYCYTVLAILEDTEETSGQIDALLFERSTSLVKSGVSLAQDVITEKIRTLATEKIEAQHSDRANFELRATVNGGLAALHILRDELETLKSQQ